MKLSSYSLSLLFVFGLGSLSFAALPACDRGGRGGPGQGDGQLPEIEKPVPVVAMAIATGPIREVVMASSTIEAEQQVNVHSEATGRIKKIRREEGDMVRKGELLAQVRREAQSSQLQRASVNLDKAQLDYERIKDLHDKGAISREELKNAESTLQNAKLDRQDRKREVGDTRVKAPFAGMLTERMVNNGAYVGSGEELFTITDYNTLVARVYVPERELDRLHVGQTAEVEGKAAKGRAGKGTIKRIAPIVDATTGTVKITVALPPELSGGEKGFVPGMYAEVTLTTDTVENALLVPKPALVREEERTYVFVVGEMTAEEQQAEADKQKAIDEAKKAAETPESDKAEAAEGGDASTKKTDATSGASGYGDTWKKKEETPWGNKVARRKLIKIGLQNDDNVQVISGLEAGEMILVAGQSGLRDGAKINLVKAGIDGVPEDFRNKYGGATEQPDAGRPKAVADNAPSNPKE